jgi:hypothetical protein
MSSRSPFCPSALFYPLYPPSHIVGMGTNITPGIGIIKNASMPFSGG